MANFALYNYNISSTGNTTQLEIPQCRKLWIDISNWEKVLYVYKTNNWVRKKIIKIIIFSPSSTVYKYFRRFWWSFMVMILYIWKLNFLWLDIQIHDYQFCMNFFPQTLIWHLKGWLFTLFLLITKHNITKWNFIIYCWSC